MIPPIVLEDLTTGVVTGSGVFDKLMQVTRAHLDVEFDKNRIRGPEYSQVYLGQLTQVMSTALQYLLQKDKVSLEAELLAAQLLIAKQQADNLIIEGQNLVLQGQLLAAQKQNLDVEREFTIAKTLNTTQQTSNLETQDKQTLEQTKLVIQQTANAMTQNVTMLKEQCKLAAEYDLLLEQRLKTTAEIALYGQKTATERAQTVSSGVDADSVIGKQKTLYQAQADGFKRDAEQKAAKLLVDSWSVRRTTDEGTVADGTNQLNDASIGRAVNRLLQGVGA